MPSRRHVLLISAALLAWLVSAPGPRAQTLSSNVDGHVPPGEYQKELEEAEESLRQHKWKAGLRKARRLAETLTLRSWYGKELGRMLSELALFQAVAEANLGKREEALWHWHIAQNLSFKMRNRDLSPYDEASKLLLEFPLRKLGEVPVGFVVPDTYPGGPIMKSARQPEKSSWPTVLNNTGAALEGSGNFHAEVIVDKKGHLHQPVVTSTHLHPIVIYSSLEWLREISPFRPALFEGEPSDDLYKVTVQFQVSRW